MKKYSVFFPLIGTFIFRKVENIFYRRKAQAAAENKTYY
jgi:hypothetical protein